MHIQGVTAAQAVPSRPLDTLAAAAAAEPSSDSVRLSGTCRCGPSCSCSDAPQGVGVARQADVEAGARRTGSHAASAAAACSLASGPAGAAVSVMSVAAPQPADLTARLKAMLGPNPFVISAQKAESLQQALGLDRASLLQALVPVAREHARPPISNYQVGAAGLGKSGQIYLGVNLEFGGNALNQTVHGEQFTVANALRNGEEGLEMLAVSAAPCGHCRQWLNEVNGGGDLTILTPNSPPTPLKELLPASFGPADLGVTGGLLSPQANVLDGGALAGDDAAAQAALQAARASYAPYSHSPSGVAIEMTDGHVVSGSYAENAAFNPSLSPLQAALIGLVAEGRDYRDILRAVLVERQGAPASQESATETLLESIAPAARFEMKRVG